MVGPHLDDREPVLRLQPQQILRHADLIVRISDRVEHPLRAGGGGENRAQHLLDAGFADAAGDRRNRQLREPPPVQPRDSLIAPQRIGHSEHRNRARLRQPAELRLRDAERSGPGGDRRRKKVVRIEIFARERDEKPPGTILPRIGEYAGDSSPAPVRPAAAGAPRQLLRGKCHGRITH